MTGWVVKRFWTTARAEPVESGFTVLLDARPLRTPAKAPFVVPGRAMAEAAAAEWNAQTDRIDPRGMPVTRSANAAIDKVRVQFHEVAALVAAYGGTDLLCYRAAGPAALAERQGAAWGPLLDWAASTFGARLAVTEGVVPVSQPAAATGALGAAVSSLDPFRLTALHDLVALTGSLVLGLAAAHEARPAEEIWDLSRIDEEWQATLWGRDDEATRAAAVRRADFLHAFRFWQLAGMP